MRSEYAKEPTDPVRTLVIAGYLFLLLGTVTFFIIPGIGLILLGPALAFFSSAFVVWRQRHRSSQ